MKYNFEAACKGVDTVSNLLRTLPESQDEMSRPSKYLVNGPTVKFSTDIVRSTPMAAWLLCFACLLRLVSIMKMAQRPSFSARGEPECF